MGAKASRFDHLLFPQAAAPTAQGQRYYGHYRRAIRDALTRSNRKPFHSQVEHYLAQVPRPALTPDPEEPRPPAPGSEAVQRELEKQHVALKGGHPVGKRHLLQGQVDGHQALLQRFQHGADAPRPVHHDAPGWLGHLLTDDLDLLLEAMVDVWVSADIARGDRCQGQVSVTRLGQAKGEFFPIDLIAIFCYNRDRLIIHS